VIECRPEQVQSWLELLHWSPLASLLRDIYKIPWKPCETVGRAEQATPLNSKRSGLQSFECAMGSIFRSPRALEFWHLPKIWELNEVDTSWSMKAGFRVGYIMKKYNKIATWPLLSGISLNNGGRNGRGSISISCLALLNHEARICIGNRPPACRLDWQDCATRCVTMRDNLSCLGCFGIFWRDNIRSVRKKLFEFANCLILLLLHLLDGNATMRWRCKNYKLAWASICAKTKAPPLCFYLSTLFSTELRVGAFTLQIQLQVASIEALALPRCSCRKQHVSHRFCFNIMSLSKFDLYQPLLASVCLGNLTSNILSTSLDTVSPSWASCDLEQPTDSLAESDSEVAQAWTQLGVPKLN
jgi:hypothetical protein